ncbi:hypothetical protein ACFPYN_15905 [Paenisporosarcina macmurdoensis]|uniref:Uncharacterized protein n=1 Tax=Paenisporosarcina macmurdoensis TaxID=212659 RepID=A0ABW1LD00_9BACL
MSQQVFIGKYGENDLKESTAGLGFGMLGENLFFPFNINRIIKSNKNK